MGAALTGLLLALIKTVPHPAAMAAVALGVMGGALAGVGLVDRAGLAIALSFIFGLGSGLGATLLNTMLITLTPAQELGRVMSVSALASYGGIPVSYALSGWLVAARGVEAPFIFGGLCAVAALAAFTLSGGSRTLWSANLAVAGEEVRLTDDPIDDKSTD